MSTHKTIDRICVFITVISVLLTLLFMNGEALGLQKVIDEDAEVYTGDTVFTENDLDGAWDTSSAAVITLEGEDGTVSGNGAYFLDGNLVIASAGCYVISGELSDGFISVDTHDAAKVWILLDGVKISCSDNACIRIGQADKVFLTLAEGTENILESGPEYSQEALDDKTGGVIYSHDDLTINGSGTLTITAEYKHGIDVNDSLVITGGSIRITSAADALHANDSIDITGADITINTGDDAIHCDTRIGIYGGTILMESCYEGIEAPQILIEGGDITICPEDDGLNANGGNESLGAGGLTGGRTDANMDAAALPGTGEAKTTQEETLPSITINGGTLTILNENGRDADGIDSNGDIIINDGTILVSMGNSGGSNGLDYGSENGGSCVINGGTVVAGSSSSMAEEISTASGQCNVMWLLEEEIPSGAKITVYDEDRNTVFTGEIPFSASAVTISCPELVPGENYSLTIEANGEEVQSAEVSFEDTSVMIGNARFAGGMGNMMHGAGGMMPGPGVDGEGTFGGRPVWEGAGESESTQEGAGESESTQEGAGKSESIQDGADESESTQDGAGGSESIHDRAGESENTHDEADKSDSTLDRTDESYNITDGAAEADTYGRINTAQDNDQTKTSGEEQILQGPGDGRMPQMPEISDEEMRERMADGQMRQMDENGPPFQEQNFAGTGPWEDRIQDLGMQMQQNQTRDEESENSLHAVTEYGADTWILLMVSVASLLLAVIFVVKMGSGPPNKQ